MIPLLLLPEEKRAASDKIGWEGALNLFLRTLSTDVFLECVPKWDANPDLRGEDWKNVLLLMQPANRSVFDERVFEVLNALKATNAAKTHAPPPTRGRGRGTLQKN